MESTKKDRESPPFAIFIEIILKLTAKIVKSYSVFLVLMLPRSLRTAAFSETIKRQGHA